MNMYEFILLVITSLGLLAIVGVFFKVGFSQKKLIETIEGKFDKFEKKFEQKLEKVELRFGLVDKNYQNLLTRVAIIESKLAI